MNIGTVLSSILAVILALAFVLGLAWGVIFLLKKWQDRQLGTLDSDTADWSIRFLRSMPLGQRERVVLIEVRGETMLIGVTTSSMALLSRWPPRVDQDVDNAADHLPPRPEIRL